ncbi:hypothetical protein Corgl_0901 [Coriobacterium glomerans PW2]|uniref:Uncharacterized protein n=1 Tax=Coriobacterium glomerans (strain ATCC 49209 / DSM 20642 / JCM 10262 / PW2) TaxID=700015 RepID=F2N9I3_CORGP|nr:hypothetical protein [Coriobacterium glomerans]AEB07012.1 hypothetical protein Corgl_0901 [Coriobacterium glomerans PW2]
MGVRRAVGVALGILALALRLCSIALCCFVVILCFSGLPSRLNIVGLIVDISRVLPPSIAGYGVISSPFGGVFRFDFSLMAVALFILDFIFSRIARMLR